MMNEDVPSGAIVKATTKVRSLPDRARVVVDLDFSRAFLQIWKGKEKNGVGRRMEPLCESKCKRRYIVIVKLAKAESFFILREKSSA